MPSPEDLEKLAKKRVQDRLGFFIHLALYAIVNLGLFAIWALTAPGYPWFLWPLVCWGGAVAIHGVTLWIGPGSRAEARAVERELVRLRHAGG